MQDMHTTEYKTLPITYERAAIAGINPLNNGLGQLSPCSGIFSYRCVMSNMIHHGFVASEHTDAVATTAFAKSFKAPSHDSNLFKSLSYCKMTAYLTSGHRSSLGPIVIVCLLVYSLANA